MTQTPYTRSLGLLLAASLFGGCTHTIDIPAARTTPIPSTPHSIASTDRVPLVLDPVQLTHNGSPQDPSLELERRFLSALHQLSLFSQLSQFDTGVPAQNAVTARLTVQDTVDSHPGQAALKGVVIGASLFLLAPVLDLHYDYGTTLTLELERWDGTVKTYRATAAGTANYNLFAANPGMIAELKGHVLESGITDLMEQVVRDTGFYLASSAPASERQTLTVRAKPARRSPAALATSVIRPAEQP